MNGDTNDNVEIICQGIRRNTTVIKISKLSQHLFSLINHKERTVTAETFYDDDINNIFIDLILGSTVHLKEDQKVKIFVLLIINQIQSLEKILFQNILKTVNPIYIVSEYENLLKRGFKYKQMDELMIRIILSEKTILFDQFFMNLPVPYLRSILKLEFHQHIHHSLLFAFILSQISSKKEESEPLLEFVNFDKLSLPQMMDLYHTLNENGLHSLAYLVISLKKLKESRKVEENGSYGFYNPNISLSLKYREGGEFNGLVNLISKFSHDIIVLNTYIDVKASSNDPKKIIRPIPEHVLIAHKKKHEDKHNPLIHKNRFHYRIEGDDDYWKASSDKNSYIQLSFPTHIFFNRFSFYTFHHKHIHN